MFNVVCRKRMSSPRCRSELIDSAWVVIVLNLKLIAPKMFSLDHYYYERWMPVHLNEMRQLHLTHPRVYQQFVIGKFTVQKSNKKLSRIGLDHNHECQNKRNCILDEFESFAHGKVDLVEEHHDSCFSSQSSFYKDVKQLLVAIGDAGNPFLDGSDDLYDLETKVVVSSEVVRNLYKLKNWEQSAR